MNNENETAIEKLRCAFPSLTKTNQEYILGFTEGLKKAQQQFERKNPKIQKQTQADAEVSGAVLGEI